jgi:hypothetical protein
MERNNMQRFFARVTSVGGDLYLVDPVRGVDPGFGGGMPAPGDPDYGIGTLPHPGHGLPGYGRPDHDLPWAPGHPGNRPPGSWEGRPGNALPVPPVRPSVPIVLPPGMWPPALPPGTDNTLPGVPPDQPIFIPPNPDIGIDLPIYLPQLPAGTALIIALTGAHVPAPKGDAPAPPPNTKPAILWQGAGTKPVLVYVSAAK